MQETVKDIKIVIFIIQAYISFAAMFFTRRNSKIYLIKNNEITVAIAVALLNYKSGIMTLVMEHISSYLELAKNFNISCDRVFSILDNKTFEKEKFGSKHFLFR